MEKIVVGLIAGRHEMPVSEYIIDKIENVMDFKEVSNKIGDFIDKNITLKYDCEWTIYADKELTVYVTGLTYVTACLVALCAKNNINLTLMHFNNVTGEYVPQVFEFEKLHW